MAIREKTLRNHGSNFIFLDITTTLEASINQLHKKGSPSNDTYLVTHTTTQYRAILFIELEHLIETVDDNIGQQPLWRLPIPQVNRIEPVDTQSSGIDILNWLAVHPGEIVLVTDDTAVVGVLSNPNRSDGVFGKLTASILHGPLADLTNDPRLEDFSQKISSPKCSNCHQENYPNFDTEQNVWFCPDCGENFDL